MEPKWAPPPWEPDAASNFCRLCGKKFGLTVRKHHCRACGRLCCSGCTPGQLLIPGLQPEGKKHKVCSDCLARPPWKAQSATMTQDSPEDKEKRQQERRIAAEDARREEEAQQQAKRVAEDRQRLAAQQEATRRAEEERQRASEMARKAEEDRQRQAQEEAARRAEEAARLAAFQQQEAARAEEERQRLVQLEAARKVEETTRLAAEAASRPALPAQNMANTGMHVTAQPMGIGMNNGMMGGMASSQPSMPVMPMGVMNTTTMGGMTSSFGMGTQPTGMMTGGGMTSGMTQPGMYTGMGGMNSSQPSVGMPMGGIGGMTSPPGMMSATRMNGTNAMTSSYGAMGGMNTQSATMSNGMMGGISATQPAMNTGMMGGMNPSQPAMNGMMGGMNASQPAMNTGLMAGMNTSQPSSYGAMGGMNTQSATMSNGMMGSMNAQLALNAGAMGGMSAQLAINTGTMGVSATHTGMMGGMNPIQPAMNTGPGMGVVNVGIVNQPAMNSLPPAMLAPSTPVAQAVLQPAQPDKGGKDKKEKKEKDKKEKKVKKDKKDEKKDDKKKEKEEKKEEPKEEDDDPSLKKGGKKIELEIKAKKDEWRPKGAWGFDNFVTRVENDLKKPTLTDTWLRYRDEEKALFVEWLPEFEKKYGEYKEACDTLKTCKQIIQTLSETVEPMRVPLRIKNKRDEWRPNGQQGFDTFVKNVTNDLAKPKLDEFWFKYRQNELKLIVDWLEVFKVEFGEFPESKETIAQCDSLVAQLEEAIENTRVPLQIKGEKEGWRPKGQQGYDTFVKNVNRELDTPKADRYWIQYREDEKKVLVEWLESFKSQFGESAHAQETIAECEKLLERFTEQVEPVRIPYQIKAAKEEWRPNGNNGFEIFMKNVNRDLYTPKVDGHWISYREKEKKLIVEWLEEFKSKFGEYPQAQETIGECEKTLERLDEVVEPIRVPFMIKTAKEGWRPNGNNGFETFMKNVNRDLDSPKVDGHWISYREKEKKLIVEWLEEFKSKFGEYPQAQETIGECEKTLERLDEVVEPIRVPFMIKTAKEGWRPNGNNGFETFMKNVNRDLDTPKVDGHWISYREKEKQLIVEWLEDFKSKFAEYAQAQETINEADKTLRRLDETVEPIRVPYLIKTAREGWRPNGQQGFETFIKNVNRDLDTPKVDNYWLQYREKEKQLLVEWLEDFKSKFAEFPQSLDTISEAEKTLTRLTEQVDLIRVPLLIKSAREEWRPNGVQGFENFMKNINRDLDTPKVDGHWLSYREKEKKLIVEWLEDFKSKLGEFFQAQETIDEAERTLQRLDETVEPIRVPFLIKTAREEWRPNGQQGFQTFIKNVNRDLDTPKVDGHWLQYREKEKQLLVEWLEDFKSKFGEFTEAQETIDEAEKTLERLKETVEPIRVPFLIKTAREEWRPNGNQGFDTFIKNVNKALDEPKVDSYWLQYREKEKQLIVEWLEDFKSKLGEFPQAQETITEAETTLQKLHDKVEPIRVPLLIKTAREEWRPKGQQGFETFIKNVNNELSAPKADNNWLRYREEEKKLLVEWLEEFKGKFGEFDLAKETIDDCERTLERWTEQVEPIRIPLLIKNAREEWRPNGQQGFETFVKNVNKELDTPKTDNHWVQYRENEKKLLVEWLEDFKSKFGEFDQASETLDAAEKTLFRIAEQVEPIRIPLLIKNAREAWRPNGQSGFETFIKNVNRELDTPKTERYYLQYRENEKKLLVEWLEDFKSKFGESEHARETLDASEATLARFGDVIEPIRVPLLIKTACEEWRPKGQQGFETFVRNTNKELDTPKTDNNWVRYREEEKKVLVEWFEDFKGKFGEYEKSKETIQTCEALLARLDQTVEPIRVPLLIKNAREEWRPNGNSGFETFVKNVNKDLDTPKTDKSYLAYREKEKQLLVEWLEDFKSKFGESEHARETIEVGEAAVKRIDEVIGPIRVPLLIKTAREDWRPNGQSGFETFMKNVNKELDTPKADNNWVRYREAEKKLLVEWLEDFKGKFAEYDQARATIEEAEATLAKIAEKVEPVIVPLNIKNAKEGWRPNGQSGFDTFIKNVNKELDTPRTDQYWLTHRESEKKLLVEWIEDFKSKFGEYEQARETVVAAEETLAKFVAQVEPIRIPLLIKTTKEDWRPNGQAGFDTFIKNLNKELETPKVDRYWLQYRENEKKLLVEWLEDFKSKFGEFEQASATIEEAEKSLARLTEQVEPIRAPLLIKTARDEWRPNGQQGFETFIKNVNAALDAPKADNNWLRYRETEQKLLVEWLEDFKSKFGEYAQAQETIQVCDTTLKRFVEQVEPIRIPLQIKNAKESWRPNGQSGFATFLRNVKELDTPKVDRHWLQYRETEQKLLVEWLEEFKSKFGEFLQAQETITEAEMTLSKLREKVDPIRIPLLIKTARDEWRPKGQQGFETFIKNVNKELDTPKVERSWVQYREEEKKVLVEWLEDFKSKFGEYEHAKDTIVAGETTLARISEKVDPIRIPLLVKTTRDEWRPNGQSGFETFMRNVNKELDNPKTERQWVRYRENEKNLLVEWLEDFKSKFGEYEQGIATITEAEAAIAKYAEKVEPVRVPLLIKIAREEWRPNGQQGFDTFVNNINKELETPKTDRYWIQYRENEKKLLVEWLEDFKSKFGEFEQAQETINVGEKTIAKITEKVEPIRVPLLIKTMRESWRPNGQQGYETFIKNINKELDAPKTDHYWVQYRENEKKLLVEWLEDFKSQFGEFDQAQETINEAEATLVRISEKVEPIRIPLLIKTAKEEWRPNGQQGYSTFVKNVKKELENPKTDHYWVQYREKEKQLLIEWLEDFKSKFGEFELANETINECNDLLARFNEKVEPIRVPLLIKTAREEWRPNGQSGFETFIKNVNKELETPKADNYWLRYRETEKKLLVEWLEDFRSKFEDHAQAQDTIKQSLETIEKLTKNIDAIRVPLLIKNAKESWRPNGQQGYETFIKSVHRELENPKTDNYWVQYREKEKKLLVEWLEEFKSELGEQPLAQETIKECEDTLVKLTEKVEPIRIPLLIKNAKESWRPKGQQGFDTFIKNVNTELNAPKTDTYWVRYREEEQKVLVEWLEDFRCQFGEFPQAHETIKEAEATLAKYTEKVEPIRVPLLIKTARESWRPNGVSGFEAFLKNVHKDLDNPKTDNYWIDYREKEKKLVIEWLEDFKCKYGEFDQAKQTIDECEALLVKWTEKVEPIRIPLLIKNAREAWRPNGQSGFETFIKNVNKELDTPKADRYWLQYRENEKKLLVEWLEDFKSKFGEFDQAKETISEAEATLAKWTEKVEPIRVPLLIKIIREEWRPKGQCGFDTFIKNCHKELDEPKTDNYWLRYREEDHKLLVEWLEDFKSKLGEYEQAQATIDEANAVMAKYFEKVEPIRVPLLIKNARDEWRPKGQQGFVTFINNFNKELDTPKLDNNWVRYREEDKKVLVEWLEDFKSKFGEHPQAQDTIRDSMDVLTKYAEKVEPVRLPLLIKNAREEWRPNGQQGFDTFIKNVNRELDNPKVDTYYLAYREKEKQLLVEWLEDFKCKFGDSEHAHDTISTANDVLLKYEEKVEPLRVPLLIKSARAEWRPNGQQGFETFIRSVNKELDTPKTERTWLQYRENEKKLLVEWLEDFKTKFGDYTQAQDTIRECNATLVKYTAKVEPIRVPLQIKTAKEEWRPNGQQGFATFITNVTKELNEPKVDRNWVQYRENEKKLLVEWLEEFKSSFGDYAQAQETITEANAVLAKYALKVEPIRVPLLIKTSKEEWRPNGQQGFETFIKNVNTALDTPQVNTNWLTYRTNEKNLLVEWLEDFKSKFGEYPEAQETIRQAEAVLIRYTEKVDPIRVPLLIKSAKESWRPNGQQGFDVFIKNVNRELDSPKTETQWVTYRENEKKLLIEWIEDFKTQFGEHVQAQETIREAEAAIAKFAEKVDPIRIPLLIKTARAEWRPNGQSGFDTFVKNVNQELDKPQVNVHWLTYREKESTLLVEWLEDFKSKFAEYAEAQETIREANAILVKYREKVDPIRLPLLIKLACEEWRPNGQSGFETFVANVNKELDAPKADNYWLDYREREKKLLVEWLEDFKSKFGEYIQARETINTCIDLLAKFTEKVDPIRVPLLVKNAKESWRPNGQQGFDAFIKNVNQELDKPQVTSTWLAYRAKEKTLLVEWLEDFKSKFGEYEQAQETINTAQETITKINEKVDPIRVPLLVKTAREEWRPNGQSGFETFIKNVNAALDKPEVSNQWLDYRARERKLLVEWLEEFKSKFGEYEQSQETIAVAQTTLDKFVEKVDPIRVPLLIQNARNEWRPNGQNGFSVFITNFTRELDNPQVTSQWLAYREAERKLLIEWLEEFKTQFGEYAPAQATIEEAKGVLAKYSDRVDPIRIPLLVKNARNEWRPNGQQGFDTFIRNVNNVLETPQVANTWIEYRTREQKLLVEWLEDFRSKFGEYKEARETIRECKETLAKLTQTVEPIRVPLLIKNARESWRPNGQSGYETFIKNVNKELDSPQVTNTWVDYRNRERKLLVEWLEDFKSQFGEYAQAQETINECQSVLSKFTEKLDPVRIPLLIKTARESWRPNGQSGLETFLRNINKELENPQVNNTWIDYRAREQQLLIEWVEDFKSEFGEHAQAQSTIAECQATLQKMKEKVDPIRVPLLIKNAREEWRPNGHSGFDTFIKNVSAELDTPKVESQWLEWRSREKKLLVEWLEEFKSQFGEYPQAQETINQCQATLKKFSEKVDPIQVPLLVKTARNSWRPNGQNGLETFLKNVTSELNKPQVTSTWLNYRLNEQKLLVEWLEEFKSEFGEYPQAQETIKECQAVLDSLTAKVEPIRVPLLIKTAQDSWRPNGQQGYATFMRNFTKELDTPQENDQWLDYRAGEKKLLVEWLENFKSEFGEYPQAQPIVQECQAALAKFTAKVTPLHIPVLIKNARNNWRPNGQSGLEVFLKNMHKELDSGLPSNGGNQWMEYRANERRLLVEWLEDFKSQYGEHPQSQQTITECTAALKKFSEKVDPVRVPLLIRNARNDWRPNGQSGLEVFLKNMHKELESGLPANGGNQWMEYRARERKLLMEWLEEFKSEFGEYPQAQETIKECQDALTKYTQKIEPVIVPLLIKNAREAWRPNGYQGLAVFLANINGEYAKELPAKQGLFQWVEWRTREKKLLVEWLEDFRSQFSEYKEAQPTIDEVNAVLAKYTEKVEPLRVPLLMQHARDSFNPNGGRGGFEGFVQNFSKELAKGIPKDNSKQWLEYRAREKQKLVEFMEEFKAHYAEYEQAQATIKECQALLVKYTAAIPKDKEVVLEEPKKAGAAAGGKATEEDLGGDEDDSGDVMPQREEEAKADNSEPPAVEEIVETPVVSKILDPEPDRKYPDFEFGKLVMKEIEEKEKAFQKAIGKEVVLALDWESFTHSSAFKDKNENDQKAFAKSLGFSLMGKISVGDGGISAICADKEGKLAVHEFISRICVIVDPKNEISTGFKIKLEDTTLEVTVNFKESPSFSCISGFKKAVEELLGLPLRRAVGAAHLQVRAMSGALQNVLNRKSPVAIRVDLKSITSHPEFLKEKTEMQVDLIKTLVNHARRFLISGNGDSIAELCSSQPVIKGEVFRRVSLAVVTIDMNEIREGFSVKLDGNTLFLTVYFPSRRNQAVITKLSEKIDEVFSTVFLKSIAAAKPKLKGYESTVEAKIKHSFIAHIDWYAWVTHKNFLSMPVTTQATVNDTILNKTFAQFLNNEDGLCELWTRLPPHLRKIAGARIKKLSISFNPTNSITDQFKSPSNSKDPYARDPFREMPTHYKIWLDYCHFTLHVQGNLTNYNNGWPSVGQKLIPILNAASLRAQVNEYVTESRKTLASSSCAGKKIPITINWEDFFNRWELKGLPAAAMETLMKNIHNIHIKHCVATFKKVCSHPIAKKALQEQVNSINILVSFKEKRSVELKSGVWTVVVPWQEINSNAGLWHAWQLRWALAVSIPVFKDLGIKLMDEFLENSRKVCGTSDIKLDFDWDFIDRSEFLAQEPQKIVQTIKQATRHWSKAVFNGLNQVAGHPVGKECIQSKIREVKLKFDPVVSEATRCESKHSRDDSRIEVQGETLYICCNPQSLSVAVKSRYKERIEFAYDLVVAIARSNALPAFTAALKNLQDAGHAGLKWNVTHENFTLLNDFKYEMSPPDQADVITGLYSTVPTAIAQQIRSVLTHKIAIDTFKSKVELIDMKVDPTNKTVGFPSSLQSETAKHAKEPSFVLNAATKTLEIVLNLSAVLTTHTLTNWGTRIVDALDVLVPVACEQTDTEHLQIIKELHTGLTHNYPNGKTWPVVVDWASFTKIPEFVAYHPDTQWAMVKAANVGMLRTTLTGDAAFSTSEGLCKFPETIEALNKSVDNIRFTVKATGPKYVELSDRTLVFTYGLDELRDEKFKGCHFAVEDLLELRPIKLAAAIARAHEKINQDTKALNIPIEINWGSWTPGLSQAEFVATIYRIARIPKAALMERQESFGDVGLYPLCQARNTLRQAISQIKLIHFSFDPTNSTGMHIGRSRGLNPGSYVLSTEGSTLTIKMNLHYNPDRLCGVGRVAQFFFCSQEAHSEERDEIRRIAANMRQQEEDRRRRETESAEEENRRILEQNRRDQEDYNRKMQEWNKEMNEKCNYSQCRNGYERCGYCNEKGWVENNKNRSTCHVCKGPGKRPCGHCNGTMKKYPNGKSQPSLPSSRSTRSLPTFGSMPDYENMI